MKTKHLFPLLVAVLTIPSLQTFADAPINFEVVVTFDYPGAFETVANAINNHGDVGGWCAVNPRSGPKGFVRLTNGEITGPLKAPGSESGSTYLEGINSSGTACGYYSAASGQPGFLHADQTFIPITVGGAVFTYLGSVNDAGDYCGTTALPSATFVNIGGTTTTFNVPGADATGADGINNLDQVVGSYSIGGAGFGYRRDADGTLQYPFAVPGMSSTGLRGINDRGWMVGRASESGTVIHGVLFNSRGAFALYDYPGAVWTYFTGINNGGLICGTYEDDSGVHGFIVQATIAAEE
ncbi:MAG TPA: hypothetical protein VFQ78_01975 [Candidatus Udaeobacter sp.]|nr:hypothetical protein [Candidatus Udaeobacter sp.]